MDLISRSNTTLAAIVALMLTACGGSGGDNGPTTPSNNAPTSNAGTDQSVDELSAVTLSGTGSDADAGDTLTFAWTQTAGPAVTLTNANMAAASFDAPDVLATATPVVLTFQLAVGDGTATTNSTTDVTVNDVGLGANSVPTANAGPDQAVAELITVTLNAAASSDPDGTALVYGWLQTAGTVVALSDQAAEQPTFTSPDVTPGSPVTLTFELTVNDGTDTATDVVDVVVSEGQAQVAISGTVSYEFVNPNVNCAGLNFLNVSVNPIRAATVQLIDGANAILGTTVAGDDGGYAFTNIDANIDVRVRVRAELQRGGTPNWDVEVRDNVDTSAAPPALTSRPLYVTEFASFNSGVVDVTDADFTATTGWNGATYAGDRAAAPFAILDAIYSGMQLVLTADPAASFSELDAFWNVNNTPTSPTDVDAGEFASSFYSNSTLFLLGDANADTEEFDDHVTVHEWGHYFEDNFSRSDSIGGAHAIGGTIDPRLAFGEGWATALAAMALDEPQYCDTGAAGTTQGFGIDTENENFGPQGYYNEMSVATLIYDLFDTNVDDTDTSSIGFDPIFEVMTNEQRTTEAFTTLFSFATELRANLAGVDQAFAESQFARENVDLAGLDIYGSNQTTVVAGRDILPIYTTLPVDGSVINICANSDFDSDRDGNKLSAHRLLRITTTAANSAYTITATANPVPPATTDPAPTAPDVIRDRSDPDVFVYRDGGLVAFGNSEEEDAEMLTTQPLPADNYVMALQEFRYSDEDASSDFPEQVCFDVSMSP